MEEPTDYTFDQDSILGQARELAALIADSEEVERFKQAEKKVSANETVQQLIATIKQKQKRIVTLEHNRKYDQVPALEQEIAALQEALDQIPVVVEFKQSQADINELLQMVTRVIANKVSESIIVSTGGDPLSYQNETPPGMGG